MRLCCIQGTVTQDLAKCPNRSVMILIPSGMAESDGGSAETVVLTDPLVLPSPSTGFRTGSYGDFIAFIPATGFRPARRSLRKGRVEWLRTRSQH